MKELKFITIEQIITFNQEICKREQQTHILTNRGSLESAVGNSFLFLEDSGFMHGSIPELAATLCFKIAKNHPFFDGNKRTAAITSLVFLELNDYDIDFEEYGETDTEFSKEIYSFLENRTDLNHLKKWFIIKSKMRIIEIPVFSVQEEFV